MVCLSSGRFSIMAFKVAAKPRSRILSASSSTTKKKKKNDRVQLLSNLEKQ